MHFFSATAACLIAAVCMAEIPADSGEIKKNSTLISVQYGNVFKEGIQRVELSAVYENKGMYAKQITVRVRDEETGFSLCFSPAQNAGYRPAVLLADFTGDGVQEIFFDADSGGSGGFGYGYVFSVADKRTEVLFGFDSFPNRFTAVYADRYKAEVSAPGSKTYSIDLSARDKDYLSALYDERGILKKPKEASVSGVNTVLPFFENESNRYNLLILRRITGLYGADALGYTEEFLRFDGSAFIPYFTAVAVI